MIHDLSTQKGRNAYVDAMSNSKTIYQLMSTDLLMGDEETLSKLYVHWDNKMVRYITTDFDGANHQYFNSTKHPEDLTEDERYRVLSCTLSKFDKDEIVNYNDLFLQGEFIETSNIPKNYTLSEEWLNY
jgi:hypothetical protein